MQMPLRFMLALFIASLSLLYVGRVQAADDLQVLDHCDEHTFPGDGRSQVVGSHGCSAEPDMLGNWMIEAIEDGVIVATEPVPFAWGSGMSVNRHVVGVYARNMETEKTLYLKIPKQYQLEPNDPKKPFAEAIHFGYEGGLAITCQREGRLGAILWNFDQHPRIVDFDSIQPPPFPAQLPVELANAKRFRQDLEGWFYAELPKSKRLNVARAFDGGYFIVGTDHTNYEYIGLTTTDGKSWQWKHNFPLGDNAPTIELPANLVPLKRLVFADYVNGSSVGRLKQVDADGIRTLAEFSSGLLSALHISGNQKYAMVDYSIDSEIHPIDEAYTCLCYDLEAQTLVKQFALPEVVCFGITDRMKLLVRGKKKEFGLVEKLEDGSTKRLQEFTVLQPAKVSPFAPRN